LEDRLAATRHVIIDGIRTITVRQSSVDEVDDVVREVDARAFVGPRQPLLEQACEISGKSKWLLGRIEGRSVDAMACEDRCR
jgi:hypothetical protein